MSEQVRFKIDGCKVNADLASICITFVKDKNGEYVLYEDYEKLKSRLASVEAILKVCFSKEPLKITHCTKNRND